MVGAAPAEQSGAEQELYNEISNRLAKTKVGMNSKAQKQTRGETRRTVKRYF